MNIQKPATTLIFIFFFGSGFAALLYQIVWLKYLNLLFGSTTYATAAVLTAFMFGLSFGSRLSTKWGFLFRASLRTYGFIEICIGLFAISFPYIYSELKIPFAIIFNWVGPQTHWYNFFTFFCALAVLLVPTSLMGATLPVLSHYLIQDEQISRKIGLLYGINTGGAVAGIILTAFLFIPALGLRATVFVGVLINLLIGLVCFVAGKEPVNESPPEKEKIRRRDSLLFLYGISGMVAIAYEVLWTRVLVLHLGSSVYSYAIMLSVFLVGISLGSYLAGKLLTADQNHFLWFGSIQLAWGFSILLQLIQFVAFSDTLYFLVKPFPVLTVVNQFVTLFAATAQSLFLPTFLSGALFPIVVSRLWKKGMTVRESSAVSYSINTFGGILGSLLAGFFLLPVFGTQRSLLILAGINITLGLIAFYRTRASLSGPKKLIPVTAAAIFLTLAIAEMRNLNILESAGIFKMEGQEKLLHLEEDLAATISVERRTYMGFPYDSLSVNGVNVAGTSPNLTTIQKLQGHIPIILFGPKQNKNVLHIGFGSGGTAYAVSLYPNTHITVVELSRGVVKNANAYFESVNHGVSHFPNIDFIYFDGRSFLQNTRQTFDVILSDSIHPRYVGNGSLYTKDYYELVYTHLSPEGVHSQWIPLYSVAQKNFREILRAFHDVFPETYVWYINSTINPYVVVTGKKGSPGIHGRRLSEAFAIPVVQNDLKRIGVFGPNFLLDYFLFGRQQLDPFVQDFDPETDDRLTVEYESSRVMNYEHSWWLNFRDLLSHRERVNAFLNDEPADTKANYERFYDATTSNLEGQLLFLSGNRQQAKQAFAAAQAKNAADQEPFEYYHVPF